MKLSVTRSCENWRSKPNIKLGLTNITLLNPNNTLIILITQYKITEIYFNSD